MLNAKINSSNPLELQIHLDIARLESKKQQETINLLAGHMGEDNEIVVNFQREQDLIEQQIDDLQGQIDLLKKTPAVEIPFFVSLK